MEKRKGGGRREAPPGRRRKKRVRESHREKGEEKSGRRWEGHEGDFGSENYDISKNKFIKTTQASISGDYSSGTIFW